MLYAGSTISMVLSVLSFFLILVLSFSLTRKHGSKHIVTKMIYATTILSAINLTMGLFFPYVFPNLQSILSILYLLLIIFALDRLIRMDTKKQIEENPKINLTALFVLLLVNMCLIVISFSYLLGIYNLTDPVLTTHIPIVSACTSFLLSIVVITASQGRSMGSAWFFTGLGTLLLLFQVAALDTGLVNTQLILRLLNL